MTHTLKVSLGKGCAVNKGRCHFTETAHISVVEAVEIKISIFSMSFVVDIK